jgi:cytochrome c oxidase subunit II
MNKLYLAITGIGILLCSAPGLAQDAKRGVEPFKVCAGCHGFKGEGNQEVGAPKLAGQQGWYLARQIKNFRDRIRGASEADARGHTMSQMASSLMSDAGIQDLVSYIGTLPAEPAKHMIEGDEAKGKQLFSTCAACHGASAEGDPNTGAPALAGMDDWYQLAQLEKFKNGVRGADVDDTHGRQMASIATMLPDEQAMKDVIAYIGSL